jgi:hypothetical protein
MDAPAGATRRIETLSPVQVEFSLNLAAAKPTATPPLSELPY